MGEGNGWDVREQDLIRLLARWAGDGKAAGMENKAGMIEMVLLAKATAIIARDSMGLSDAAFASLMREAFHDG
jgi:hypothetical protein